MRGLAYVSSLQREQGRKACGRAGEKRYIIGNFSMTKNRKAHSEIVAMTNIKNAMRLTKRHPDDEIMG